MCGLATPHRKVRDDRGGNSSRQQIGHDGRIGHSDTAGSASVSNPHRTPLPPLAPHIQRPSVQHTSCLEIKPILG
jgi:hypothetical protein